MRQVGAIALAVVVGAIVAPRSALAERVLAQDTTVALAPDGSAVITESITYDFGTAWRRGLDRHLHLGTGDAPIRIEPLSVTDVNGRSTAFDAVRTGRVLTVRVGEEHSLVSGVRTYVLTYRARGLVRTDGDNERLDWLVSGAHWPVAVGRVSVRVSVPSVGSDQLEHRCVVGSGPDHDSAADVADGSGAGSSGRTGGESGARHAGCARSSEDGGTVYEARDLAPGAPMLVSVTFPRGVIQPPSLPRRVIDGAATVLAPWMIPPGFLLAWIVVLAWRGRRASPRPGAPPLDTLPRGVAPAEAGLVWDGEVDMDDLVATVLHLAARGHLRVGELGAPLRFGLAATDFVLIRDRECLDPLSTFERALLDTLFEMSDEVTLSSLRGPIRAELPQLREALYASTEGRVGAVRGAPEQRRRRWAVGAYACGFAALVFLVLGRDAAVLAAVASGLVAALGGVVVGVRTPTGGRLRTELARLRRYLERGPWTPERAVALEHYLPYALVLGAADTVLDGMIEAGAPAPVWLQSLPASPEPLERWQAVGRFARALGAALRAPSPSDRHGEGEREADRHVARRRGTW